MLFKSLLRIFYFLVILLCLFPSHYSFASESKKPPKLSYTTAGTLRFPYSLQPNDDDNIYSEAFFKVAFPVWKTDTAKASLFLRGFYSSDSQEFSFNNRAKLSIGLSYNRKLSKTFSVSFDLQYDIDNRYTTHQTQTGWRGKISYFYFPIIG